MNMLLCSYFLCAYHVPNNVIDSRDIEMNHSDSEQVLIPKKIHSLEENIDKSTNYNMAWNVQKQKNEQDKETAQVES